MSMNIKIGSARIDENGKAKGGKAGDQTGKEVSTQDYYVHKKGWRVFRAINPNEAAKIADDMQFACANKNIGYDQGQRLTLYNVSKEVGFNCSKVTKKCETDCSALVRVCCAYAGISLPNFRTSDEASVLLKSGAFVELKGVKYTDSQLYLRRGDILVTRTQGHTVVVLENGSKSDTNNEPIKFDKVMIVGKSVNVRMGAGSNYKSVGYAYAKEKYPYLGKCENGWYNILYNNKSLWVTSHYSVLTN